LLKLGCRPAESQAHKAFVVKTCSGNKQDRVFLSQVMAKSFYVIDSAKA
jgi:hypothetical protein